MVNKTCIYSSVLLLLFSIAGAAGSFAFTMDSQSYGMSAVPIGGSADNCGIKQLQHDGLFSATTWANNVPNPFKPRHGQGTMIMYNLSSDTGIKLMIYSITGQVARQKSCDPGTEGGKTGQNSVFWDGKNDFGEYVGNGVYIYMITAGSKVLHIGHMAVTD